MPRVPASSSFPASVEAQIDAAVMRLVDLFARQVARELAADALAFKEPLDAEHPHEED